MTARVVLLVSFVALVVGACATDGDSGSAGTSSTFVTATTTTVSATTLPQATTSPPSTTVPAATSTLAPPTLPLGGPELPGAPQAVRDRPPLPFCGLDDLTRTGAEVVLDITADSEAAECFASRFESSLPAELVRVVTTIEGDAIVTVLRTTGDGSVVLFTDATRDGFGTQAWFAHVCEGFDASVGQPTDCVESAELDGGVEALQIDGVWVFQHDPSFAMDAIHSGFAEIRNGCLYVDDSIVVWHSSHLDLARETVATVQAGGRPELLIGGGGVSLAEGGQQAEIPAAILERCAATAVWFGSP